MKEIRCGGCSHSLASIPLSLSAPRADKYMKSIRCQVGSADGCPTVAVAPSSNPLDRLPAKCQHAAHLQDTSCDGDRTVDQPTTNAVSGDGAGVLDGSQHVVAFATPAPYLSSWRFHRVHRRPLLRPLIVSDAYLHVTLSPSSSCARRSDVGTSAIAWTSARSRVFGEGPMLCSRELAWPSS